MDDDGVEVDDEDVDVPLPPPLGEMSVPPTLLIAFFKLRFFMFVFLC